MDDKMHKELGVEYNQRFWKYYSKGELTEDEKLAMLNAAYTSLQHWMDFSESTIVNRQRGEYLIAKAWLHLGNFAAAEFYAERCLDMTLEHQDEMQDFDVAFAYELKYKCARNAGKNGEAEKLLAAAREKGDAIKEKGDRDIFFDDLGAAI